MRRRTYYHEVMLGNSMAALELEKLRNDKWYKPEEWVENTLEILSHCERVFDIYKVLENHSKADIRRVYRKLIWSSGDSQDKYWKVRTLAKIRKIKSTIEDILERKKVSKKSLKTASKFFTDLADRCIILRPSHGGCFGYSLAE